MLAGAIAGCHGLPASRCPAAEPASKPPASPIATAFELDPETAAMLKEIDAVGAYGRLNLPLKIDANYAHTPSRYEPFGPFVGQPHKRHFLEQMEYTGPGRAIPEPEHVDKVRIGFLGPIKSTVSVATGGRSHEEPLGIKMKQGCELAIAEANARGGYLKRKIDFELVVANDNGLWGSSGEEIVKFAYDDKYSVWAILGTIDSANSHISIRVALKAEIVMMNTGDTDPTFIETNIPWVMRNIGDDRQMGYLLADYLYGARQLKRVGIIRSSNRYGRFGVRELRDSSRRLGFPVVVEMPYRLGSEDFSLQLERVEKANVEAVVHWGGDHDGARILNQMRARGMKQPFFACDRCASAEFVKIAGPNAEGVICGYPWDPTRKDPKLDAFRRGFRNKFNEEPETYAAHAYDGMNMLIWAVQAAGLNRAKIRDVIAYRTRPWPGVTGDILFGSALDDVGDVYLAKYENGGWKYLSRRQLDIPPPAAPPAQPRAAAQTTR